MIPTSGGISVHVGQCAAIAEILSGESVENSLFAPPEGRTHIKSTLVLYDRDPWPNVVPRQGGSERDKEETEEEGRKEGTGENRTGGNLKGDDEDSSTVGSTSDGGSPLTLSASAASDALLLLNTLKCSMGEGESTRKILEGAGESK